MEKIQTQKNLNIEAVTSASIVPWMRLINLATSKGIPLAWNNHPFMVQPLMDWAPNIVFKKPTQIGFSTTAIVKILYKASKENLSVIYTLPTTSDVRKFVTARVDPMIENCSYLRAKMRPYGSTLADSTELKRVGGSTLYFRGSWTEQQAQSIDADIVVIDELDFSKPEIAEMYEERLEGADSLGWMYQFSVPSIPGVGVDRLYDDSCQFEWYNKCPKCKKLQCLNIFDNLDRKNQIYRCKSCKSRITSDDRRSGVWIARYPKREVHGYHISQLAAPWISAERLIKKELKAKSKKHFYNYSLGLAYNMQTKLIGDKEIYRMVTGPEAPTSAEGTVVGIDQGDIFYITIGRLEPIKDTDLFQKRIITLLTAENEEEVVNILNRFGMRFGIMDAMPNKHTAKKLARLFKGRLFLSYYQTGMAAKEKFDLIKWDIPGQTANVQRTESLDNLVESFDRAQWVLPSLCENVKVLVNHVKNVSVKFVTRRGLTTKIYDNNGPDHFFHSLNYLNLAFEKAPRFMSGSSDTNPGIRYSGLDEKQQINQVPSIEEVLSKRDGVTRVDVIDD